eukprot:Clim_evm20s142 gene=Clim_evmTU20s142
MFYSHELLAKKGGKLAIIWLAATCPKQKLTKAQTNRVDVGAACHDVMDPPAPLALRLSATLLFGISRIQEKKVAFLYQDAESAWTSVSRKSSQMLQREPHVSLTIVDGDPRNHLPDTSLPRSQFQLDSLNTGYLLPPSIEGKSADKLTLHDVIVHRSKQGNLQAAEADITMAETFNIGAFGQMDDFGNLDMGDFAEFDGGGDEAVLFEGEEHALPDPVSAGSLVNDFGHSIDSNVPDDDIDMEVDPRQINPSFADIKVIKHLREGHRLAGSKHKRVKRDVRSQISAKLIRKQMSQIDFHTTDRFMIIRQVPEIKFAQLLYEPAVCTSDAQRELWTDWIAPKLRSLGTFIHIDRKRHQWPAVPSTFQGQQDQQDPIFADQAEIVVGDSHTAEFSENFGPDDLEAPEVERKETVHRNIDVILNEWRPWRKNEDGYQPGRDSERGSSVGSSMVSESTSISSGHSTPQVARTKRRRPGDFLSKLHAECKGESVDFGEYLFRHGEMDEEGDVYITLSDVLPLNLDNRRHMAAVTFYQTLVLANKGILEVYDDDDKGYDIHCLLPAAA